MFKQIGNFFKSVFSGAVKIFKAFLKIAIPVAKQLIVAALKDIALQAVTRLSYENLTNEEKRQQAFDEIKSYAIDRKIEVTDSLINWIIETSVQMFKGEL